MNNEREPITHELKVWSQFFADVKNGRKSFEFRVNDRDFRVGDTLYLREYHPESKQYTGQETTKKITYVLNLTDFLKGYDPSGYVVLGLAAEASSETVKDTDAGDVKEEPI